MNQVEQRKSGEHISGSILVCVRTTRVDPGKGIFYSVSVTFCHSRLWSIHLTSPFMTALFMKYKFMTFLAGILDNKLNVVASELSLLNVSSPWSIVSWLAWTYAA